MATNRSFVLMILLRDRGGLFPEPSSDENWVSYIVQAKPLECWAKNLYCCYVSMFLNIGQQRLVHTLPWVTFQFSNVAMCWSAQRYCFAGTLDQQLHLVFSFTLIVDTTNSTKKVFSQHASSQRIFHKLLTEDWCSNTCTLLKRVSAKPQTCVFSSQRVTTSTFFSLTNYRTSSSWNNCTGPLHYSETDTPIPHHIITTHQTIP